MTRTAESERRLVERIRDEILASPHRRITFARFMERALTEPGLGYYATSELRPTRGGDFLTAPELHPFFGRCLGRFIAAAATSSAGTSSAAGPYRVLEFGGGRGTLRDSARGELGPRVEWSRVDLPGRSDPVSGAVDLVLANEYLDALPVHRVVQAETLLEAWTTWDGRWFAELLDEPSTPELAGYLAAEGVRLREGQRAEIGLQARQWLRATAAQLQPGGVLLVIDYGHEATELYGPRRMAGSLLTYQGHEVADDPYAAVGHADITAHVDITTLVREADAAGLRSVGSATQGPFLARLGLGEMLAALGRQPGVDPNEYLEARASVARLLDPRHLGGFRVLAWARPSESGALPVLPGFDDLP